MCLRQTFKDAFAGYWNGGKKQIFDWHVEGHEGKDAKGAFIRVGSWDANHWFNVAKGKTEKQTLSYARRRLASSVAKQGLSCTFEYYEETD